MNNKIVKPLKGVKVIELSTFVAAPTAARVMADWGADVIKIETSSGDPIRYTGPLNKMPFNHSENVTFDLENANKRGIVINMKTSEGMEIFYKLLDDAEVFITNWREDALQRANIDYNQLKEKYPKLIYGQITGYGDDGPDKDLPGFDYTAYYARGGIMGTLYEKGTSPMNLVPGLGDHQAGMFLCAGICASLLKSRTTGEGEKVTVSLYHTAVYGMSIMIQSAQYGNHYPISRKDSTSPLLNSYKTKDERWIEIAMPPYNQFYSKFMKIIGREDLVVDQRYSTIETLSGKQKELCEIIENQFLQKDLAEWKQILTENDIPFGVAQLWEEILEDKQAWASNILESKKYSTGNTRTLVRTPVMFKEMGLPEYKCGPLIGEHTNEILEELGYSKEDIKKNSENKIVKGL
ncbi:MAG: CaiB/BaiF CoA transferase family protein [Fusobacteriaceae bacterium]